jgi:hypothetical protein
MKFEFVSTADWASRRWREDGPIMAMPFVDAEMARKAAELASVRANAPGLILAIHDSQRIGFVACVNQAFERSQSPWFGYMAQDAFAGRDWMALALQAVQPRGVLLAFNDGKWHGALASFGLASRAWASGNYPDGSFFFKGYARHYADTELTLLARQAQAYVYQPHSLLVELDWGKDRAAVHAPDRALFQQRVRQGLDGRVSDPELLKLFA